MALKFHLVASLLLLLLSSIPGSRAIGNTEGTGSNSSADVVRSFLYESVLKTAEKRDSYNKRRFKRLAKKVAAMNSGKKTRGPAKKKK